MERSSIYKFSGTRLAPSRPHPSANLIALYNLSDLASSVARTDPVTGEKRKLRKSYKGKLSNFELPGRYEPIKHESEAPGGLMHMLRWSEEDWHQQKVFGKEIQSKLPASSLAKLDKAMAMEKGDIPGFDVSVLGLDLPPAAPLPSTSLPSKTSASPAFGHASQSVSAYSPSYQDGSGDGEYARPKRQGRKRRYDDGSFEGYGEGFIDDDGAGYSSTDADDRKGGSKKKRRKTDDYNIKSPPMDERSANYGAHISSYGSGISAHVA